MRLAQTDRIGDQNTGARLAQRLKGGIELVGHQVHDTAVAQMNLLVIGDAAAALAFQVKDGGVVGGTVVGYQLCFCGVENFDVFFQLGQKQRRLTLDEFRNTVTCK